MMKFSDYCDMIEGTDAERELLEFMRKDESMQEAWEVLEKMQNVPVLGKIITALGELPEYDSIAEFRESEYYPYLMNWNFDFDPEKGSFILNPGPKHMAIIKAVAAGVGCAVVLAVVCKMCCKRKK